MKIALVTYALEIGGVESVLLSLAEYFSAQGDQVEFVETSSKGLWSDEFRRRGYNVYSVVINPFESRFHHVNRLAKQLEGYDAILINDAPFAQSIMGLLPSNIIVLPVLHNNIDSMISNAIANKGQWHKIVCVSPSLKSALIEKTSTLPEDVVVISNGVNVDSDWPKSKVDFNAISILKILFVGRVEQKQKGVLYLPQVIKNALENGVKDIELTVIGDGPSISELKASIDTLQLNNTISVLGSLEHEKVIHAMQEHHVLLMPSHFEGHPIVLMEAMAQGLVPIVSNLPGHTDHVVKDSENGYLCDTNNLNTFTDAIVNLHNNKALLQEMSQKAWETVYSHYSKDAMGLGYLELINILQQKNVLKRTNQLEKGLLGDLPYIPHMLVRPIRKLMRLLGLWKEKQKIL